MTRSQFLLLLGNSFIACGTMILGCSGSLNLSGSFDDHDIRRDERTVSGTIDPLV